MKYIIDLLKGMVIGVSNIIPGVSGGTMAVVMGIYDKIIYSVNNFFKDIKRNILFLGILAIGAAIGILLFTNVIDYLIKNYNEQTNFFFIGLIIGTVPLLYKRATKTRIKGGNLTGLILGFAIVAALGILEKVNPEAAFLSAIFKPNAIGFFVAGFIAAATMILPGISGSFVLLLIGLYEPIIESVKSFHLINIGLVGTGVLVGFLLMTKLIERIFNKYPQTAYCIILGLVIGSVFVIYPGFTFGIMGIVSILTLILGFLVAYFIGKNEN
ncbi:MULTISPECIES: DUF368 domain-containing protein [unclassified Clostridium]|uniref:DUF368 domain-containing protein n=1 Tax=unclassified Clostridium TaxID=2614128 RepID=UPI00290E7EDA|nr:DUF368 domain-containing protein [Clostridium sp.]MDU5106254.1 DUF368 domain-containing protein [Clostridium sp.]